MMRAFWASGLPAIAVFAFGVAWTGAMTLSPRSADEPVAAIFPPSMAAAEALGGAISAGADAVIATGALDTIIIATSKNIDFADRLRRAGAIFVMRAPVAGYCAG